jgi:hypothetical protein
MLLVSCGAVPSVGASGAVFAVATAYLVAIPFSGINLFFVFPMESKDAVWGIAAMNVAIMALQALKFRIRIDGAGHLGGMVAGSLSALAWMASDRYLLQTGGMLNALATMTRREEAQAAEACAEKDAWPTPATPVGPPGYREEQPPAERR